MHNQGLAQQKPPHTGVSSGQQFMPSKQRKPTSHMRPASPQVLRFVLDHLVTLVVEPAARYWHMAGSRAQHRCKCGTSGAAAKITATSTKHVCDGVLWLHSLPHCELTATLTARVRISSLTERSEAIGVSSAVMTACTCRNAATWHRAHINTCTRL
jgi:hypothetical protein